MRAGGGGGGWLRGCVVRPDRTGRPKMGEKAPVFVKGSAFLMDGAQCDSAGQDVMLYDLV